jgi:hypothetical protein
MVYSHAPTIEPSNRVEHGGHNRHQPSDLGGIPQEQGLSPSKVHGDLSLFNSHMKCAPRPGASAEYGPTLSPLGWRLAILRCM